MRITFIIGFLLFVQALWAQPCAVSEVSRAHVDSCLDRYPGITNISEPGKTSFIIALSHFPELNNTRIRLKYKTIGTTLNVRPTICSLLFNKKNNRKYIVRINNSVKDSIITLNEIPSDAQVGLFGHELCHIVDYNKKNIWGVMGRGFAYLNSNRKSKYEKEMDSIAIKHGLGCQLYLWASYVLYDSGASTKYKSFKRTIYMKPEEIKRLDDSGVN